MDVSAERPVNWGILIKGILVLLLLTCTAAAVILGIIYAIKGTIDDRRQERAWFHECIADGRKAYECNAMIRGTWRRPFRD